MTDNRPFRGFTLQQRVSLRQDERERSTDRSSHVADGQITRVDDVMNMGSLLRNIRWASLPWRTEDPQPDARPDKDDEPPYPDERQSYSVFFLAPGGEKFHFEDETDCMEEPEDAEGEGTETTCPGEGWIGCAVGISLVAPYAAISLCSCECYEDGTISIPDVESLIYSDKTQQRVDTDRFRREILSQEAFQTLEALRAQIGSILAKHRIQVLDRAVLNLRAPGLKASEEVFLEEPLRVQDAFFFRGV